ncbi:hypothetical protein FRACYDRAFT_236618 [Fragilariopsis cylindrus CCMP1102]|uniref:Uncharacterized protein n=1 Tax=Fragilariopsis cylindrus CCMP1102 TaxID=635003 RepID=A0A1E7FJI5_9STRA|nr:hypothetical protein FRACYDRAFT_236618 [Fragilariopsis cylindrus CCMP1102]|eukprot:OEU18342.1 hypothetical protein FRACYDRAFT_236618 [Fragilariopsis cylindrus CCMP1102]
MTMIVILLKRLLFVVATIIATTSAAPASKCGTQTTCSKCFIANPNKNCTWIIVNNIIGNPVGACIDADNADSQCNTEIQSVSSSLLPSCATGVDAEKRAGMKKKKLKRKNQKICKKLKKSFSAPRPTKSVSCSDYSGNNCKGCLSNNYKKKKKNKEGCSWVSDTNACVSSCSSTQQDVDCTLGLKSKILSKSICKAIKVKEQIKVKKLNSKLCQSNTSQLNCNECTQTKLKLPNGQTTKPVQPECKWFPAIGGSGGSCDLEFQPTCQWFPAEKDVITIGASGGFCNSKCTSEGDCGVTTCNVDDPDDDLGEQNSELCQSKSQLNCNECTQTKLKLPKGLTTQVQPTCQWFPADKDVITIGASGGFCNSKCNKENGGYSCGVTACDAVNIEDIIEPTVPLPRLGEKFPQYGPKSGLTGKDVKDQILDQWPRGKFDIIIIEDGSPVTKDLRFDRIRIYVESNDDRDDLGDHLVMDIPRVG